MEYEEKEAQLVRIIKNVSFSILRSSELFDVIDLRLTEDCNDQNFRLLF